MKDIIFIGDGLGVRTLPAKMMGLNVLGTDISQYAIEHSFCIENMTKDDITNTKLIEQAKLVVCYDVLEHLKYEDLDRALKNIFTLGLNFVFSIPFEGDPNLEADPTHIIKEDKEWWVEKLSEYFNIKDAPQDWLFANQILIGEKK